MAGAVDESLDLGFHVDRNTTLLTTTETRSKAQSEAKCADHNGDTNEAHTRPRGTIRNMSRLTLVPFFIALACMSCTHVWGFATSQSPTAAASRIRKIRRSSTSDIDTNRRSTLLAATATDGEKDPNEIIATRIVVTGDVNGGYYRSCVKNEVGRKIK